MYGCNAGVPILDENRTSHIKTPHETTMESMKRRKRALDLPQTEMHSSSNSDHSYCSAVMKLLLKSLQVAHQSDVSPQGASWPLPTLRDRNWLETLKL